MFENAKEIPFAPGYFADTDGEIYNKSGRKLAIFKNQYGTSIVNLKADGVYKNVCVEKIMKKTFFSQFPPDYVLWHKNGIKSDFRLENLKPISCAEFLRRGGRNGAKKAVAKIDQAGNVIEVYSSATEAAEKNFFSRTTICFRCKGKINQTSDTFRYVWAEDIKND